MRGRLFRVVPVLSAVSLLTALSWAPSAIAATPKCFGKSATIVSNKSLIVGTKHADVIVAGKGNNTIKGLGGNDLICGGGGKDKILGGAGADKLNGQSGTDMINGGGGNDLVIGGAGNDGTFECLNSSFNPVVFLTGGGGSDVVKGGGGDDCLGGGPGNDKLFGEGGNDILFGDPGTDTLNGGTNGNPLVNPSKLGDTASFIFLTSAVNANLTTGHATSTSGGSDTLTGIENLFGTAFGDTLIGNSASTVTGPVNGLEGGPGDDTIDGNGGAIEIAAYLLSQGPVTLVPSGPGSLAGLAGSSSGGEGNDNLDNMTGAAGSNFADSITWAGVIFGGDGGDTITLVGGSIVSAGAGDDTVNGSSGNDQISGDEGDDTINGNAGNDQLDGDTGGVNIVGTNDVGDGGAGTDTCVDFETVTTCE